MPPGMDVTLDLESPLVHKGLRADDQTRMSLRVSWGTGSHNRNSLNGLAETHVVSKDTSLMAALFLGLHPRQPNRLMLHQGHLECTWSLILIRLCGLSNIFDAGEQIPNILREICFLVSPM